MKVIIAGGRDLKDYEWFSNKVSEFFDKFLEPYEIIEGGAKGADSMAGEYAEEKGIPLQVIYADWKSKGRSAGPIRNEQMAKKGTHLLAFWDGKSRGTGHMIKTAGEHGLDTTVVYYNQD